MHDLLNDEQRRVLAELVEVPAGARVSTLERLRRPVVKASGPQMERALARVAEIAALGVGEVDVSVIPPRRMAELWRYGMDGKATLIDRHGAERKLATLLATVVHLTTRSVDDALDEVPLIFRTRCQVGC
ncbi:hypothetical protein [Microtetraspora sp. NBRC 13810]|uniref:hypothetical protein n=1 Tax=Microtetraspora sp. NBRC 13810 TaxID=3030990 RepID=UPI00255740CD|nr:hypothetical protein [Microtetraspora sp. NBRC 13810]